MFLVKNVTFHDLDHSKNVFKVSQGNLIGLQSQRVEAVFKLK